MIVKEPLHKSGRIKLGLKMIKIKARNASNSPAIAYRDVGNEREHAYRDVGGRAMQEQLPKDAVALLAFRKASAPRFWFPLHSTSYLPVVVLTPLTYIPVGDAEIDHFGPNCSFMTFVEVP